VTGMAGFHENGPLTEVEIGSALGIRAFDVDAKGRLTSVVAPHIWRPGINTAAPMKMEISYSTYGDTVRKFKSIKDGSVETHGFYSYHNGHDEFERSSRVTGVVRNTGDVRIGEHGFRSECSEIVAVVIPEPAPMKKLNRLYRLAEKVSWLKTVRYEETKIAYKGWAQAAFFAAIIIGFGLFLPLGFTVSSWFFLGLIPSFLAFVSWFVCHKSFKPRIYNVKTRELNRQIPDFSRVKYSYGDNIQYFPTRAEMLKAFPLYKVKRPTPADDEYWTS